MREGGAGKWQEPILLLLPICDDTNHLPASATSHRRAPCSKIAKSAEELMNCHAFALAREKRCVAIHGFDRHRLRMAF
jgi:hypothetical protein